MGRVSCCDDCPLEFCVVVGLTDAPYHLCGQTLTYSDGLHPSYVSCADVHPERSTVFAPSRAVDRDDSPRRRQRAATWSGVVRSHRQSCVAVSCVHYDAALATVSANGAGAASLIPSPPSRVHSTRRHSSPSFVLSASHPSYYSPSPKCVPTESIHCYSSTVATVPPHSPPPPALFYLSFPALSSPASTPRQPPPAREG